MSFLNNLKASIQQKKDIADLEDQAKRRQEEREHAEASEDLAPLEMDGKKRKYHYKDVEIVVFWQFGGQYGKSLRDIGMKRGDSVQLVHAPISDDPQRVLVVWDGNEIGELKHNRLREMVLSWKDKGYPVFSAVNGLYAIHKAFFEIAFYGYIRKPRETEETK